MELYCDDDQYQDLEPSVVAELRRLRLEEGYEIQILEVNGKCHRPIVLKSNAIFCKGNLYAQAAGCELIFSMVQGIFVHTDNNLRATCNLKASLCLYDPILYDRA